MVPLPFHVLGCGEAHSPVHVHAGVLFIATHPLYPGKEQCGGFRLQNRTLEVHLAATHDQDGKRSDLYMGTHGVPIVQRRDLGQRLRTTGMKVLCLPKLRNIEKEMWVCARNFSFVTRSREGKARVEEARMLQIGIEHGSDGEDLDYVAASSELTGNEVSSQALHCLCISA